MLDRCPCCDGPLVGSELKWLPDARVLVWDGSAARLSKNEACFFEALWKARRSGRILQGRELAEIVWGDDPNGGPDSFLKGLGVLAYDVRLKIKGSGITVTGDAGSTGGYRLVKS